MVIGRKVTGRDSIAPPPEFTDGATVAEAENALAEAATSISKWDNTPETAGAMDAGAQVACAMKREEITGYVLQIARSPSGSRLKRRAACSEGRTWQKGRGCG